MIQDAIKKVIQRKNLSQDEMYAAFDEIMSGKTTNAQIGSFITALGMKGETVDEVTGAVRVMREKAVKVVFRKAGRKKQRGREVVIDTCGTGGSGLNAFNISTTVAFVIAACGVKVAKHGNRSISSKSGSADVLERLGVNISMPPERVGECIDNIGIGFLFAPLFHGAMKYASGPRKEIGIRTIFNILGPLSNPAGATHHVLGVYDKGLIGMFAMVLKNLGCKRALVVHGADGLDEITITGKTFIAELRNEKVTKRVIYPKDFGLKPATLKTIRGDSAEANANIVMNVLAGKKGSKLDIVLMNAAACLVTADKAKDFRTGVEIAKEAIGCGGALAKLNQLREETNK